VKLKKTKVEQNTFSSKRKIFNDPVYGFITIPHELIFDIVQHPYFQRLRRITQLGLTNLVYPGANHTRFQHALGATHLMGSAIEVLRSKGKEITHDEALGVLSAILLHDVGHGPYSHTLESTLVEGVHHETISKLIIEKLNRQFEGKLDTAISIFKGEYYKNFLHQLVSSQLDIDRLDYLKRDSFFTGVSEGVIGSDRIIKMLDVVNDELAIEAKGIYSIEKFIVARRLMYWQVYLHKTVLAAEFLLTKILQRAKQLAREGSKIPAPETLKLFLKNTYTESQFANNQEVFSAFLNLDDYDILSCIKNWCNHPDKVLSTLSNNLINRKLNKIILQKEPIDQNKLDELIQKAKAQYRISDIEASYLVYAGDISNNAYNIEEDRINILFKNGKVADIAEAADLLNISVLSKQVTKHFLCFPKELLQ
jgi:HD superfamily phosphohydrolase